MALALANALLRKGMEVWVYCLDYDRTMPLPGSKEEQDLLNQRIRILDNKSNKRSTLSKSLSIPKVHLRLERSISRRKIDLVISFMERANLVNLIGDLKIPRIISIRKHPTMGLRDKGVIKRLMVKFGYSWLLRRASNINLNSAEAAKDLLTLYPATTNPISVINNFFDPEIYINASETLSTEDLRLLEGESVITCGRLVPVKSQASLIKAFSKVVTSIPEAKLIIVGDGPTKKHLTSLINQLHLSDKVFLVGVKSNPFSWISRAKVFALSSKSEGFPNALLEAMALSRPVISSDCQSGPRELLHPDSNPSEKTNTLELAPYGLLVPPQQSPMPFSDSLLSDSEEALAKGIKLLLTNKKLRKHYAKKSSERSKDFTRAYIIEQWEQLIREVLQK